MATHLLLNLSILESVAAWKVHRQQCWSPLFESFQSLILSRATVTMDCYSSINITGFHSL